MHNTGIINSDSQPCRSATENSSFGIESAKILASSARRAASRDCAPDATLSSEGKVSFNDLGGSSAGGVGAVDDEGSGVAGVLVGVDMLEVENKLGVDTSVGISISSAAGKKLRKRPSAWNFDALRNSIQTSIRPGLRKMSAMCFLLRVKYNVPRQRRIQTFEMVGRAEQDTRLGCLHTIQGIQQTTKS